MTREEAIEEIKNYEKYPNGLSKECRDYIVKALEQEPMLDKIREQIKSHLKGVEIALEVLVENDPLRPKMEGAKDTLEECLELIDKYKAESEGGQA